MPPSPKRRRSGCDPLARIYARCGSAAACPEAYSAAVPTKPAAMSPAATMPAATMPAATAPATAAVCFEGEKRHDEEQHRGNASAGSHGAAGLAPHRRGRLSLSILPRTKSFQY